MTTRACANCGATGLDPGFIEDTGQSARGYARWFAGTERGVFGGVKRLGKQRFAIEAHRCIKCSYLNLYVGSES